MPTHSRKTPADPNLALRIRYQLRVLEKNASWLAGELGRTRAAVSHWVTGRYEPPRSMIPKIAKALGVSVEWLMGTDLTDEQREAERRRIEALLAACETTPAREAAAFLAEIEKCGGIQAATELLAAARLRKRK